VNTYSYISCFLKICLVSILFSLVKAVGVLGGIQSTIIAGFVLQDSLAEIGFDENYFVSKKSGISASMLALTAIYRLIPATPSDE
jgi:hypothetical protein